MITAKQSSNGKIVIPRKLRGKLRCKKGDLWEFIPSDEDPDIITMRRVTRRRNEGLAAHLAACPHSFEIPTLSRELGRKLKL